MAQSWLKTSENPLGVQVCQVWSLSSLIFFQFLENLLCLVSAEGLKCGASSQNIARSQSRNALFECDWTTKPHNLETVRSYEPLSILKSALVEEGIPADLPDGRHMTRTAAFDCSGYSMR